jgi:hypothetical protein
MGVTELDLTRHKTIADFMKDNNSVRVVVGPVGSGKSTGVGCGELVRRALMQEPSPKDNIRYFKALIVRNTQPELRKTTLKTWLGMYPETLGKFNNTALTHHIKVPATDDVPGLDLLVEFTGLDGPQDAAKLLSWEGTLIWFNEAKEINKEIVDMATARVGRYPSMKQGGVMPTWYGLIMDTNPYTSGHWLDKLEKDTPANWTFYRQPPGVLEMQKTEEGWVSLEPTWPLSITDPQYIHAGGGCDWAVNPKAENLNYLPVNRNIDPTGNPLLGGGYYAALVQGKDKSYISIYLQGKNGALTSDQAVIPEFDNNTMVSSDSTYNPGLPLQCGIDFGAGTLNPAAVFGQLDPIHNRWTVLREVVCQGMGLLQFADQMNITINEHFPQAQGEIQIWGDPAGLQRDGVEMKTYFDHLRLKGLIALPAPTNKIDVRIECIRTPMLRYSNGKPSFLVNPKCAVLVEALTEKWCYNRLNVAGEVRFDDKPNKSHPYSDVADALGYMLSGGGEHATITSGKRHGNMGNGFILNTDWDVF